MIPLTYNVRSLFVRKTTTVAAAFGVALVVFVLAAAMMLGAGIKKTMSVAGKPDNAIVLRKGSDNELSSNLENRLVNLVLAAPGVKTDESSKPLGSGEVVIVIALDKLGLAEGSVSNVLVRGVTDNVFKVRPQVKLIAGRPAQPGTDEVIAGKGVVGRNYTHQTSSNVGLFFDESTKSNGTPASASPHKAGAALQSWRAVMASICRPWAGVTRPSSSTGWRTTPTTARRRCSTASTRCARGSSRAPPSTATRCWERSCSRTRWTARSTDRTPPPSCGSTSKWSRS